MHSRRTLGGADKYAWDWSQSRESSSPRQELLVTRMGPLDAGISTAPTELQTEGEIQTRGGFQWRLASLAREEVVGTATSSLVTGAEEAGTAQTLGSPVPPAMGLGGERRGAGKRAGTVTALVPFQTRRSRRRPHRRVGSSRSPSHNAKLPKGGLLPSHRDRSPQRPMPLGPDGIPCSSCSVRSRRSDT